MPDLEYIVGKYGSYTLLLLKYTLACTVENIDSFII